MKIVKVIIEGVIEIPRFIEPWNNESLYIHKITHIYDIGGFDVYLNSMFGLPAEDEFYTILPIDCELDIRIIKIIKRDNYYEGNDFKRACYNRGERNQYQLPKWTTF